MTRQEEWRKVARKRLQEAATAEKARDLTLSQFSRNGAAYALRMAASSNATPACLPHSRQSGDPVHSAITAGPIRGQSAS